MMHIYLIKETITKNLKAKTALVLPRKLIFSYSFLEYLTILDKKLLTNNQKNLVFSTKKIEKVLHTSTKIIKMRKNLSNLKLLKTKFLDKKTSGDQIRG